MILHFLGIGFFAVFWLMAARGLADASGPFTRRLSILQARAAAPRGGQGNAFSPAQS